VKDTIRVLVVDDSPLVRTILVSMLTSVPSFEIVGKAKDGEEAVRLTASLHPDVITVNIHIPRFNGLEATRQIMHTTPTPIVVVASSVYESDLNIAFKAIGAGALTVVEKPRGLSEPDFDAVRDQLVMTVRLMSDVQVVTLWSSDRQATQVTRRTLGRRFAPWHGSRWAARLLCRAIGANGRDLRRLAARHCTLCVISRGRTTSQATISAGT
jgi:two-component system, chemotaxis family, protein-glutamate methylesterase/glutaminase